MCATATAKRRRKQARMRNGRKRTKWEIKALQQSLAKKRK